MLTAVKPARQFSNVLLDTYRQQGDVPADAVIAAVIATGGPTALRTLMKWLGEANNTEINDQPAAVQAFFATHTSLPTWADPSRMARGMALFGQYAGPVGLILGCFSLPYCYLGAKGAQVLWLTERIKNDTARRLQETGEWLFAVMNPKEWPQKAVIKILKIRLIHAGARWFSLHSGRWQMDWGYPVNQEDMAGTNLAFSYIVLRGLRQSGIVVSEQDEEDYLHHVNVIGSLNGVAEELLPRNLREAWQLDRAIARRQFAASEAGVGLTRALINAIGQQAASGTATNGAEAARNLAAGEMRFFMGDAYADLLGIPAASVEKRLAGLVNRLPIFPKLIPARPQ